jgi:hypothetical protein
MQDQNGLTPDERELELAMKSLSPAAVRIDPISAAFAAGLRSGRRPMRLWRAAALFMLLIGAGSWLAPFRHPVVVQPHDHFEPAIALQTPAEPRPLAAESVQMLQQIVSEKGLDGLPAANIPAVHILRVGDIF